MKKQKIEELLREQKKQLEAFNADIAYHEQQKAHVQKILNQGPQSHQEDFASQREENAQLVDAYSKRKDKFMDELWKIKNLYFWIGAAFILMALLSIWSGMAPPSSWQQWSGHSSNYYDINHITREKWKEIFFEFIIASGLFMMGFRNIWLVKKHRQEKQLTKHRNWFKRKILKSKIDA